MVRQPLSDLEKERGHRLGRLLRRARHGQPTTAVAAAAGISSETLRKIERGGIPTPAFFTVAALAKALNISLDQLYVEALDSPAKRASDPQTQNDVAKPLSA